MDGNAVFAVTVGESGVPHVLAQSDEAGGKFYFCFVHFVVVHVPFFVNASSTSERAALYP